MDEPALRPTIDDFADRPWEHVLAGCGSRERFEYNNAFCARYCREEDPARKATWGFLAKITAGEADLAQPRNPFGRFSEQYDDADVALLEALHPRVADPELGARIADLIWALKPRGNHRVAESAVIQYQASARCLEDPTDWTHFVDRTERALQIARLLRNRALQDEVIRYIEEALGRHDGTDPTYMSANLMRLLLEKGAGDPARWGALAEKKAAGAEREGDYHKARDYWDIKASWEKLAGGDEAARASMVAAAETYVKQATLELEKKVGGHLHAAGQLSFAIRRLRNLPGQEARIETLVHQLHEHQRNSTHELSPMESGPIDLTEEAREAERFVTGKGWRDALLAFACVTTSPKYEMMRGEAVQMLESNPLVSLFPSVRLNAQGKTVSKSPSYRSDDPEEVELAILNQMYFHYSFHWDLNVLGVLEPARSRLLSEHGFRVNDIARLVAESAFVPPDRVHCFAQGIHAGMTGDFLLSSHLLIPQLEHSLRYVLAQHRVITTKIDAEGIQQEFDLNRMLKEPKHAGHVEKILSKDILYDLRGLLVDPFGANLRNNMAHGLIGPGGFFAAPARYLWWLTLRLCLYPLIAEQRAG